MKTPVLLIAGIALALQPARGELIDQSYGHQMDNQAAGQFFENMTRSVPSETPARVSRLPVNLQRRITEYLGSRVELRQELQKQVESRPAGMRSEDTVKAFTAANENRIAGMIKERDAIRVELTKFVAKTHPASDPSLDKLLQAFDVQYRKS